MSRGGDDEPILPGLEGMRALVTGGSRGVGRATALLLGRSGASVAISYRSRDEDADRVVGELEALGARAFAHRGDLTSEEVAEDLFRETGERLGGLDLFVGNHGIWPHEGVPIAEMSTEQWLTTQRVNVESLFYTVRAAARMISDDGRIVLVSSTAGQRGEAYHGDYAASKGAVISLVKGLAVELAPRGITVNAVAPGWIDTEMAAPALQGEALEAARAAIPLRRIATSEDVAGPIGFLCTPLARHITGEILNVNGGAVRVG
ncbi:MAG: SDR family oxidoreductase [Gemmatimonadales bacterium]|nr:MAG: SDR family oxidoreductase [Gemmatimonadales bacterium]